MQTISIQNSIIVIFQIDEVTLDRRGGTLACCRFKGEHNFLRITELLEGVFASYAIPHDKIVSTVTDNGSNFVKAFKEFGVNLTSPMHATAEDDAQSQNGSDDEAEDDEAFVPSVIEESGQSLVQPPSGDRRVTHACEGGAADSTRGTRERSRDKPQGMFPGPPRDTTEWRSPSQAEHLLKQFRGRSPSELPNPQRDRRHVGCAVALQLLTVEKNPGPVRRGWRRDKSEKKERRRVRRAEGRMRKRKTQRPGSRKTTEIVTWNVQGLSLRENNRRRLRKTLAYIERRKWDITLLTEIRAESRGILWFGEEESETAVIHSEKTAVVLRGEEMRRWREERQRRRYSERSTTVKIGNMKIMAVYQPLWSNGREGVEKYREEIEE